ncbi:MAG: mandelate racemase [Alphaproteobacteria bacterium]|nr:mandelate racemase [Alphaproteobacteria bacterium]
MKILAIRDGVYGVKSAISNAVIDFSQMTVSVVAVVTDVVREGKPVVGFAFNTNGRYAAQGLLRERFIKRIMGADPKEYRDPARDNLDPFALHRIAMRNEKPGGHGERSVAVALLDIAIWDAVAKIEGKPLCRLLAERFNGGKWDERVWVYAAGGYYYPGKGPEALRAELRSYLDRGYETCKIKIGGAPLAEDMARIEAALVEVGEGPRLAVDANARFDETEAMAYGRAMAPFNLAFFEEPVDPLDYALHAKLAEVYAPPLATGENLFSMPDARNLVRHGGFRPDRDWLQFDCTLSYGVTEYLRILDMLHPLGWSGRRVVPHGGHLLSLHLAAGLQLGGCEAYPDVFKPFSGFADNIPVQNGHVGLPENPGTGYETQSEVWPIMQEVAAG